MILLQQLEQPEQTNIIHPDYSSLVFSKTGRYVKQDYIMIWTPNGWKKEHRVIWEEHNKACLLSWGHVHHKNGNRQDNRIENLEAMTIAQHSRLHMIGNTYTLGMRYYWKQDAKGRIMTEEHKMKISQALKGKPKSEQHRINIKKYHWSMKANRD